MTSLWSRILRASSFLILCLSFLGVVVMVFARSPNNGEDATVYLPSITGDGSGAPPPGSQTLGDGGVVSGVDGVTIGAVKGALTESLALSLAQATLPGLPLPSGTTAHGSAYQIGAERDVYTSGPVTFILGLPIPASTPTANLGIAFYEPGGADDPENWFILSGLVDLDYNLLLVTLPYLSTAGRTAVLIEHPGLQSPQNNPPATNGDSIIMQSQSATQFNARCVVDDETLRDFCDLDKEAVEEELRMALVDLTGMGYPQPLLKTEAAFYDIDNPTVSESNTYIIMITAGCSGEGNMLGLYSANLQQLMLCSLPSSPLFDTYKRVIRHEYYHATQAAFPATFDDKISKKQESWISEGTASLAEESTGLAMKRTPWRSLHTVDHSLKSKEGDDEYKAQDFWVYLGQLPPTNGLDRFITLFQNGATSDDVYNWIGNKDGFKNKYWQWVKNQVMVEDGINFEGELGRPCTVQSKVVGSLRSFDMYKEGSHPGTLSPLTSHVIKLVIHPELEGFPQLTGAIFQINDPDLKFKIYVDGETCTSVPDGMRTLFDITSAKDYYVIVSNINPDDSKDYTVFFD